MVKQRLDRARLIGAERIAAAQHQGEAEIAFDQATLRPSSRKCEMLRTDQARAMPEVPLNVLKR